MIVATWNVNSLKVRIENIKKWLNENKVDFLLLQEIKGLDEDIFNEFKNIGYNTYYNLQKTYNGVAILTPHNCIIKSKFLPNFDDIQARFIEIEYNNCSIINVYIPNGNPVEENLSGEKYLYKINWLNAFYDYVKSLQNNYKNFIIGGDFNIAPKDCDVYSIEAFKNDALIQSNVREIYYKLINLGLMSVLDYKYKEEKNIFTWWDYRNFGFIKNNGAKIDHILLSPYFADKFIDVKIDKKTREDDKPSDHCPVICYLE